MYFEDVYYCLAYNIRTFVYQVFILRSMDSRLRRSFGTPVFPVIARSCWPHISTRDDRWHGGGKHFFSMTHEPRRTATVAIGLGKWVAEAAFISEQG